MADQQPPPSAAAAAAAVSTLSLPQRDQCLALVATLKQRAQELVSLTDAAEIQRRVSRMMLDMLSLKRLNREVFDAIALEGAQLEALKSESELCHLELENTNYERTHLTNEIPKHRDFPTPELSKIDLVDEAAFRQAMVAQAKAKAAVVAAEKKKRQQAKVAAAAKAKAAKEKTEGEGADGKGDGTGEEEEEEAAAVAEEEEQAEGEEGKTEEDGTEGAATGDAVPRDAHALQLARLAHELDTRKALSAKIGVLEKQKRGAIDALAQISATIDSVPEMVQRVEDAAQPLADLFPDKAAEPEID